MLTAQQRWVAKNPERARESTLRSGQRRRAAAVAALGGVCVRCGFDDPRALQIDHVNGDGAARRRAKQAQVITQALAGDPGLQLLCANCNWIKRSENREWGGRARV